MESQVQSAVHILNALNNPLFKMYFTFLGYILPIINKMNREFQSESVMIYTAYSNICAFYRTILSNYIKKDILKSKSDPFEVEFKDCSSFLPENEWYFGRKVESMLADKNVLGELGYEASRFWVRCLDFYVELSKQISKRFKGLSDVLPLLNACDPAIARENSYKSSATVQKISSAD